MISENSAENVAFIKIIQMRKELIRATRSRKRLNIKHDNKTEINKKKRRCINLMHEKDQNWPVRI